MLSDSSIKNLENVDSRLVDLVREIAQFVPIRVLWGYRDQAAQDQAVASGASKTPWPTSKHNKLPALAVDLCIEPYNPDDILQCLYLNAFVMGFGTARGLKLRSGADWDGAFSPHTSPPPRDYFHIELVL